MEKEAVENQKGNRFVLIFARKVLFYTEKLNEVHRSLRRIESRESTEISKGRYQKQSTVKCTQCKSSRQFIVNLYFFSGTF